MPKIDLQATNWKPENAVLERDDKGELTGHFVCRKCRSKK